MTVSTPWQTLCGMPAWQVTDIPRQSPSGDGSDNRDAGSAQRFQALVPAYCRAVPVGFGWIRERAGGPMRVLAAGAALAGGQDRGQAVLTVPAGARGSPLGPGETVQVLSTLPCWTPLAAVSDVLLAEDADNGDRDGDVPPSLEDGLLSAWLEPFGWLLLAEPVARDFLDDLATTAARAQLAAQQTSSPRAQLAARRAAARHGELRRAASTGMWRIHLLAGGRTPQEAAHVAGLLCASADLSGLPYALVTRTGTGALRDVLAGQAAHIRQHVGPNGAASTWRDDNFELALRAPAVAARLADPDGSQDTPQPQSPFCASTRLLAALARAPAREVPGVRFTLRPEFDTTPETGADAPGGTSEAITAGGAVPLGTVLDWNRAPAGPLTLPRSSLNRHVFVCGATGAGKSQTIRGLLQAATGCGIPWLVVEPAKAEYHLMAARLPGTEVIRIRPGDLDVPPAGLNPLEPAPGPGGARFPLQVHADLVRALFLAAFQADEPFPQVLAAGLTRCYERAGWDMVTGTPATPGAQPAYPGLEDLQAAALQVVRDIGYGREVADNVRGFVTIRIASLRHGTAGRFLDGSHPLDFAQLLDRNVVLEIEDAGDDRDKAFLMGSVLIRLTEHLRLRHRAEGPAPPRLRHLTVIEEAHRLLRQPPPGAGNGPAAQATEMFADLLAEVRAYGEGLIVAEQIPAKLIPDVIKNTAVKIVHRLPAADDRDAVGATMNLTAAQSQYLVTLTPGEAAVFTDGMDYPLLARMPDGTAAETTSPADTAAPAAVITARSLSCDPLCQRQPCTLAQIRAAQNAAAHDPAITLWAELAILGALTGWPAPVPGPGLTARLLDLPERLLGCTLSHTVDAAVSARASALGTTADPAALAAHVTIVLRNYAAGGHPFPPPAPEWLAAPCQWNLIAAALAAHVSAYGSNGSPHPDASEWAQQYGTVIPGSTGIPGSTCGEQYAAVRALKNAAWAQLTSTQRRTLVFGARNPSAIEKAIGARTGTAPWQARITATLADTFADGTWALPWLTGCHPRPPATDG
jgi:uncharacterized protein